MGRCAKYLTYADKMAATRARQQAYSQTPHAQQLRLERKNTACPTPSRRKAAKLPHVDVLPETLIMLANQTLPTTYLFREAERSEDLLDETEVALYDDDPPYAIETKKYDGDYEAYTSKMIEVMGGRRSRQHRQVKAFLEQQRIKMSPAAFQRRVESELGQEMLLWHRLRAFCEEHVDELRHKEMALNKLEWRSRWVKVLYDIAKDYRSAA
ncbi:hypothetical protein ONZ45_g15792 [Pleurotus djamor]|nr:hypothetical protein ONZ45_g15792 [Pleurotus djamor]